jgi:Cu(I)/Ag(I) efflux system membrane fusion protein
MNVLRWALFAGLLVLAVVSIGSYVMWRRAPTGATHAAKKALYRCPMHPSYTSDKPGECPICGMTLERIPEKETAAAAARPGNVPGLVDVQITPERVQLIGVRTTVVRRRPLGSRLELVGFVAPDESRLRRVQLRVSGWVQQLFVSRTGELVHAGQPVLAIYSPELFQSEQEYLIERQGSGAVPGAPGGASASAQRLRLLGVPEEEIRRLDRDGTASTRLTLHSPFVGTVLERGVAEGQYVGADTPLLTLADLSRVWVLADVYEMDVTRVRVGDPVRFLAQALPEHPFEGRVDFVYPTVSSETRTVKVRVSLDNHASLLKPGMYGRAILTGRGGATLVLPSEAVVNTGQHSYVFLAHAGGHFEPRLVTVGLADGDDVQILSGVAAGDTVVSSASFLIDSESRLKAAIEGMGGPTGPGGPAGPPSGMPGMPGMEMPQPSGRPAPTPSVPDMPGMNDPTSARKGGGQR